MRNIRILLQYEGSRYQGWQKQQSTDNTIQSKLEALLGKMCGESVAIQGSGRTDAGVHALGQVANFHTYNEMPLEEMLSYMNRYLPEDIAVVDIAEAAPRFHSRLNACGKHYEYLVWNRKVPNVFWRKYSLFYPDTLDVEAMRHAAEYLLGEHDFQSFTSAKKGKKSTVRRIDSIQITEEDGMLRFSFRGNGFLYHMIRIIMGTLLEVGEGSREASELPTVLAAKDRSLAGRLVPAKGLTLKEVYF